MCEDVCWCTWGLSSGSCVFIFDIRHVFNIQDIHDAIISYRLFSFTFWEWEWKISSYCDGPGNRILVDCIHYLMGTKNTRKSLRNLSDCQSEWLIFEWLLGYSACYGHFLQAVMTVFTVMNIVNTYIRSILTF